MHNLSKIKLFRWMLWITYPVALLLLKPLALLKKRSNSDIFFFLDRYVIGGAQRIHLDVLKSIEGRRKNVYFTRKSTNDKLKTEFYSLANTTSRDIHIWCDYLFFRLFAVHFYAFYLNRHPKVHLFSSNSTFFYDMLPFIRNDIYKTELLHNFSFGKKGMEFFGMANHKYLDARVVYDSFTMTNIKNQYREFGINEEYLKRVEFIEPGVDIPPHPAAKIFSPPLKILYAGRGGIQKRIHLINRIAESCMELSLNVSFHFAGTMYEELTDKVKRFSTYHGEVSSKEELNKLYAAVHIILLTSAYEGFPMVIKEGMASACVPVVTALPGNTTHLKHLENAWLINAIEDEDQVILLGIEAMKALSADMQLLQALSGRAYEYACAHYSKQHFIEKYRSLFQRSKV